MTTEVLTQALVAGQLATFGQGTMLYLKTCVNPVNIVATSSGTAKSVRNFNGVAAGFKFTDKSDGFSQLQILSATSQTLVLALGDDDVEFSAAVSILGTVSILPAVSAAFTASMADSAIANASALSIPQNLNRSRITIGSLSTNTGSVRIQSTGAGAAKGLELVPGVFVQINQTSAIDVRNDSGATQSVYVFEEL